MYASLYGHSALRHLAPSISSITFLSHNLTCVIYLLGHAPGYGNSQLRKIIIFKFNYSEISCHLRMVDWENDTAPLLRQNQPRHQMRCSICQIKGFYALIWNLASKIWFGKIYGRYGARKLEKWPFFGPLTGVSFSTFPNLQMGNPMQSMADYGPE